MAASKKGKRAKKGRKGAGGGASKAPSRGAQRAKRAETPAAAPAQRTPEAGGSPPAATPVLVESPPLATVAVSPPPEPVPESPPVLETPAVRAPSGAPPPRPVAGGTAAVRRPSRKTWRVLGALALLAALTYVVPGLDRLKPWRAGAFEGALRPRVHLIAWHEDREPVAPPPLRPIATGGPDLEGSLRLALAPSGEGPLAPGEYPYREAHATVLSAIFGSADLEDPSGSMAHFYASLGRTKALQPGSVTRIVHLGDSPIVGDLISGGARERLQRAYGDAGHGWTLPARPWDWYYHYGVKLSASGWRARSPLFGNGGTGRCGLNGVAFESASPSAASLIASASKGAGSLVSHFWIYYGVSPGSGTLEVGVDGGDPIPLPTAGPSRTAAAQDIPVPEGRHTLSLRPKGDGTVTLYGVALERDVPGVVYDSVGTSGGTARFLTLLDAGDWEEGLRQRKPDLVILNYGTNESTYEGLGMATYAGYLRDVLSRVRRAVPEASILIMAPMDRATRDPSGHIVTMPSIPKIVAAQRAVAQAEGCAFFDTYQAMGGEGTMARWYQRESPLVTGDLTHPTNAGADIVSKLLVDALQRGFDQHAEGQTQR